MKPYIIGVDTGNKCIKTRHEVFIAGIRGFESKPALKQEMIAYKGKYYSLVSGRIPYRQDKTETDDYFVLTLFAIAKELRQRGITLGKEPCPVELCIGLPPSHVERLGQRFKQYFEKGIVRFQYNEKSVCIDIKSVNLFVQGYAAITSVTNQIQNIRHAYIVDIGGYTTDILSLENGRASRDVCASLDYGVIQMYNRIQQTLLSATGKNVDENIIDEILTDEECDYPDTYKNTAKREASAYIDELLKKMQELQIDLTLNRAVFIGGGSVRMRNTLEGSPYVSNPIFVEDVHANAKGYEDFYIAISERKR